MATIHLDYETFSACDISKCGAFRYANDPSTEILMIGLAVDDEEPVLWLPDTPLGVDATEDWYSVRDHMKAGAILAKLSNPETIIYAHNAQFEIAITDALFKRTTGFKPPAHHQWRCTAAMARRAALPASLAKCGAALKLTEQKDSKGSALIRKFSIPQKPRARSKKVFKERILPWDEPEEFKLFCDYCLQDVRTEREIHKTLKRFELKGFVLDTYQLDVGINTRGMPVNVAGLHKAQKLIEEVTSDVAVQFRKLTGLDHTQSAKYLEWLKERGYTADNLTAETLEEQLEDADFDPNTEVGKSLLLRKKISFAAVKKVAAMIACAGPHDNRVRGTLVYHGASTGRWSGSLVQPQNFKRPTIDCTEMAYADICNGASRKHIELMYGETLDVIASTVRHFIHDTNGVNEHSMLSADYAAIEARIVCWLAAQEDALEEYRQGVDRYKRMASLIYGVPVEKVNKHPQRFIGKHVVLGCGYGMSGAKFRATCEKFGYFDLEEGLEFTAVAAFRELHDKVVKLWGDTERAAKKAINNHGVRYEAGLLSTFCIRVAGMDYLFLELPSGRRIAYPDVRIDPQIRYPWKGGTVKVLNPTADDYATAHRRVKEKEIIKNNTITFFGQLPMKAIWGRVSTYGGKLVENATQGTAADIMAAGAINAERAGYPAYTLIHDEFLGAKRNGQDAKELVRLLTTLPKWANGLPIEAEGDEVKYYTK